MSLPLLDQVTIDRRLVARLLAGAGAVALTGCDKVAENPQVMKTLALGEVVTRAAQRVILSPGQLAPEYKESDISPWFKPNGTTEPDDQEYADHVAAGFKDWKLEINGLVDHPMSLSLDDIKAREARTQITRHDCVEGWSCIGKWTGMKLGPLIKEAGLKPNAKYLVFHCADSMGGADDGTDDYYESIAVADAFHPQTILAYALNDKPLEVAHGAPIRLRAEHYLGYKQAKYIMSIEAVESFAHIMGGKGGYWEDSAGYDWFAGISKNAAPQPSPFR